MLLQPLVENAIKHGLEPKSWGGMILINVLAIDRFLRIEVRDTGLGLSGIQGSGISD
jgi:sensor histidine kinase YesM